MNRPHDLAERPARDEAPEYFFQYVDKVPEGDIRDTLEAQADTTLAYLKSIPEGRKEIEAVRGATKALFRNLPPETWSRRGVASERTVSVRALAFIIAGHVEHHLRLLRERYSLT